MTTQLLVNKKVTSNLNRNTGILDIADKFITIPSFSGY
jgi:hypothetical protein